MSPRGCVIDLPRTALPLGTLTMCSLVTTCQLHEQVPFAFHNKVSLEEEFKRDRVWVALSEGVTANSNKL